MSLFNNNYNKPGPGVNKDEPKKKPFPLFWTILFRKFTDLVKLNLLFCIPLVIVLALTYFLSSVLPSVLSYLPLVLISPFLSGLTLVTRNYVREEHAFVMSDFIDAVKQNWRAFLLNGVIIYVAYVILSVSINYYATQMKSNSILIVPLALCIGIAILFLFAQYYISVMLVTFDLKFKLVYKNAFIFSILGLWKNLLLTVILAAIVLIFYILSMLMPLTVIIAILLAILILFSFCMFLINFTVYPLIDKMMVQPYKEKNDEISED